MITQTIVGSVPVDSGELLIVDPCYLGEAIGTNQVTRQNLRGDNSWSRSPGETEPLSGICGNGVLVGGFGGDGSYTVSADRDQTGRVTRVTIDFS